MSQVNSCCSCTCLGNGNRGLSSAGGGWKGLGVTPICRCGDVAVIRTARTTRNAGKKFWGCPNFKRGNQESVGCNYFKWSGEDDIDQRDGVILSQNREICSLEKSIKLYEKWVKCLIGVVGVVVVLNIILVSVLLKSP
ncbi:uncharacterized protein LOC114195055 [Vigna unguiculata]|uniref:GRF-type domain-containing protein n=1 Tax=Vigna unguiculata TaxID=3917 RepID=A0A4D6MH46_VIGUN|nr:uncharacterized protein LOC114195055 [Vigna unguiculata]QCE00753.1 hypothetical protein DEO72_LG7g2043 [Vigna unguiculata]